MFSSSHFSASCGRQTPVGGAGGEHLHHAEALTLDLRLKSLFDGLLGGDDVGNVMDRNTLDVSRTVELREHLAHA